MSIQSVPSLTQNGNPYSRSTIGRDAGIAAGVVAAYQSGVYNLLESAGKNLDDVFNSSGSVKNAVKGLGKFAVKAGAGIVLAAIIGSAGAKIGRALIDAPINQERRAQADGEAALREKLAYNA